MTTKYDRAITVFSPDGHLFQVEYAQEAVKKGSTAIAVRGKNCVVLCVEKKATNKLQVEGPLRKISLVDDHVAVAFAGLTADARVLINRMRVECKSYKLTVEDPVSLEYIARYTAQVKQKYTQSNGRRPFGVAILIVGFNQDGTPHLYQSDPSGTHFEWLANAIGKGSKVAREFLEKNYSEQAVADEEGTVKLAVKTLMEVMQSGAKHMELAVMRWKPPKSPGDRFVEWQLLEHDAIEKYVQCIEKEREEEAERKRQKKETVAPS
ncbi:Proteasome subunit alpha type-7-like [Clonorchis sinensis]|uniref:Proteasome subunit alpha type n=4 Tax=Opisthorchiidae TaxID=6196 RepID=A0A8T1M4I3_CLOSI|nr:Proteasome subunit alpha type-7-like [Clonorchis sinensis]